MVADLIHQQMHPVPPGRWAVGVSGGADSVALLSLLRQRPELQLHVVHLDHETRGGESAGDALFVERLAVQWNLPITLCRRSDIQPQIETLPSNRSARFRAVRMELFRRVVREHDLQGVILAHHADDQAETVLLRLLRSSGIDGLRGMAADAIVAQVRVLRPLLGVRREALRAHLTSIGQPWREDASNQSDAYRRNRVRRILTDRTQLHHALRTLTESAREWGGWLEGVTPRLGASFTVHEIADLPRPVARRAARRWLLDRGAPGDDVNAGAVDRLLAMACDAATPARQHFPGPLLVRRRAGRLSVDEIDGQQKARSPR